MKVKYTPGTPEGLVGKTYNVEIIGMELVKIAHVEYPVIKNVYIKHENNKEKWMKLVDGMTFFSKIQSNKAVKTRVI
jgi:hypothetical protein